MRKRGMAAVGAVCIVAAAVAGCSSSSSSGSTTGASGGGARTLNIGVLTSLSGASSAFSTPVLDGINARFQAYKADSGKCASSVNFNLVKADDQSTPQGALAAEQKLVQQDKVFSVIEESGLFFGASHWATTQGAGTPVIGGAYDGAAEWKNYGQTNLYPNFPAFDQTKVYSTIGDYLKSVGSTKVAGIAYNSPSSQASLENHFKSAQAAGLTRGYSNSTVAFGSTDVGAIVLGIKNSGADSLVMTINPDTAFAVIAGLRQANYPLKAIVTAAGYGGDLLASKPAVQAGQGVTFEVVWTPTEQKTAATTYFSDAMKKYGNTPSGVPAFNATMGWFGADLLIRGLEKAGCDASSKTFMTTLRKDDSWNAGGLFPHVIPMSSNNYDQSCLYLATLTGSDFVPVKDSSPRCGTPVSGG